MIFWGNVVGGPSRNRTGVYGFAVRCVTTPPSGLMPNCRILGGWAGCWTAPLVRGFRWLVKDSPEAPRRAGDAGLAAPLLPAMRGSMRRLGCIIIAIQHGFG